MECISLNIKIVFFFYEILIISLIKVRLKNKPWTPQKNLLGENAGNDFSTLNLKFLKYSLCV